MSYQIARETAAELGRLQQGRIAAKYAGEAIINTAIAAGEQIVREIEVAYQERVAKIVAECGLPPETTITVNFDTGEVTVAAVGGRPIGAGDIQDRYQKFLATAAGSI